MTALALNARVTWADGITALATGSGQIHVGSPPEFRTFSFTARTDDSGLSSGQVELFNRSLDLRLHGDIDCLNVLGNVATMSGHLTNVDPVTPPFFVPGNAILFQVQDNGEGSHGTPDMISLVFAFPSPSGTPCTAALGLFANIPIEHGNVQVH